MLSATKRPCTTPQCPSLLSVVLFIGHAKTRRDTRQPLLTNLPAFLLSSPLFCLCACAFVGTWLCFVVRSADLLASPSPFRPLTFSFLLTLAPVFFPLSRALAALPSFFVFFLTAPRRSFPCRDAPSLRHQSVLFLFRSNPTREILPFVLRSAAGRRQTRR